MLSGLIRGVSFAESGLIRGVSFTEGGLIRGVSFAESGPIRGVSFAEGGLIRGVSFAEGGLIKGVSFAEGGLIREERLLYFNFTYMQISGLDFLFSIIMVTFSFKLLNPCSISDILHCFTSYRGIRCNI